MSNPILSTNITASGETVVSTVDQYGSGTNVIQVDFDAGIIGSVRLFGRVSPDCSWVELTETPISADALFPILPVALLRAEVTVSSGGGGLNMVRVRSSY
jgi:hypothetical protein